MEWISVKEKLPEIGKYVLARHNRGTWSDSEDKENVNCIIVKRRSDNISGNNQLPYIWKSFGPDSFFGQEITHWMPLPEPPTP